MQTNTQTTETQAAFARRLGINPSTVCRAVRLGHVLLDAGGRVIIEASLQAWQQGRGLKPGAADRIEALQATQTAASASANQTNTKPSNAKPKATKATASRSEAKARTLQAENTMAKLAIQLANHKVLDRASVAAESLAAGGHLRSGIERLIDQLAPRLAASPSAARPRLIAQAIQQLHQRLRADHPRALRRIQKAAAP